jgi:hypothetical protein
VGFEPTEGSAPSVVFETTALGHYATSPRQKKTGQGAGLMRDWRDSNPRPLGPQPNALSTELQPPGSLYSLTIITNSNVDCKLLAQHPRAVSKSNVEAKGGPCHSERSEESKETGTGRLLNIASYGTDVQRRDIAST